MEVLFILFGLWKKNEKTAFQKRNAIMRKLLDDGYSQISIANYLNVFRSLLSKVVREEMGRDC
jgi:Trp operon repressor